MHNLTSEIKHHFFEYLILAGTAIFFVILLSVFQGQQTKQYLVLMFFTLYYVMWGVIHHGRDQTLTLKIVLEYILIGILALVLLHNLLI